MQFVFMIATQSPRRQWLHTTCSRNDSSSSDIPSPVSHDGCGLRSREKVGKVLEDGAAGVLGYYYKSLQKRRREINLVWELYHKCVDSNLTCSFLFFFQLRLIYVLLNKGIHVIAQAMMLSGES